MQPTDRGALEVLQAGFVGSPFWRFLGMEVEHLEEGRAVVRLSLHPHFTNANEGVHGGVILSLLDSAMGLTLRSINASPHVTESMTTQFLRPPAADATLFAHGKIVKNGRRLVAMQGEVQDDKGRLIATAMGTFVNVAAMQSGETNKVP